MLKEENSFIEPLKKDHFNKKVVESHELHFGSGLRCNFRKVSKNQMLKKLQDPS